MNIKFDWKYSLIEMPKKDEKIFAYYDIHGKGYERIIMGKFLGYRIDDGIIWLTGREMKVASSINFGSSLSYKLPETGFFWDYIKPNVNTPGIKELRKIKLEKLEVVN